MFPESEITVEKSYLFHKAGNKKASFADLAPKAAKMSTPTNPILKSPSEFKIMGTSPKRLDIPPKVNGTAGFGMDVVLENMKYATVRSAPVFGATVSSLDDSAAKSMKGVHKVISLDNAVAVVADGYWAAKQAVESLKIEWSKTENEQKSSGSIFDQFSQAIDEAITNDDLEKESKEGNTKSVLKNADHIVEATYKVPYLAHATMETNELYCFSQGW